MSQIYATGAGVGLTFRKHTACRQCGALLRAPAEGMRAWCGDPCREAWIEALAARSASRPSR